MNGFYLFVSYEVADRSDKARLLSGDFEHIAEHKSGRGLSLCSGDPVNVNVPLRMTRKSRCDKRKRLLGVLCFSYDY